MIKVNHLRGTKDTSGTFKLITDNAMGKIERDKETNNSTLDTI